MRIFGSGVFAIAPKLPDIAIKVVADVINREMIGSLVKAGKLIFLL
ncbi:MAG: hypothetical protein KKG99_13510 [Bacteroidetes bacterium]|nr:hypothetical protein [Bacteroidota bacterium]